MKKDGGFKSMDSIMNRYDIEETKQKRISREFQDYAYRLAIDLEDTTHTPIYMRMVKNIPREIIERARSFVIDSNAKSKARLFMWKVRQLREEAVTQKEGRL